MISNRRNFIRQAAVMTAGASALPSLSFADMDAISDAGKKIENLSPAAAATDEDFWFTVQQAFTVSPNIINLNNGGVSPQPRIVQDALDRYNRIANEGPAYYMWRVLGDARENVRRQLAELAGVSPDEIAINRNSSEGLETIILGLNLKEGDEVLTTTQDYPNMMSALHQRELREKIKVVKIQIPVPSENPQEIVKRFREAITPKTKAILMCQMINLTGQILPVRAVSDMAHEKGIEVICDGAHAFAHLDFKIPDLHCDYYATSLHKWLCAPFGSGMLWVKKEKIKNLWTLLADPNPQSEDIRKFETLGTRSFPIELAIGTAISFHNGIGSKRKEERLHYLKNYWAGKVMKFPKVKLNTSLKKEFSCAIANFSIEGWEPAKLNDKLFADYKIVATPIAHDEFKGVRITPHVYTSLNDLDYFVSAVEKIAKS
ncbi:MAG: aminotransferase class V-fold PLP-dependent enzyme [Bacteroidia bacterium]|nr:aminotransferase class V-fold PLP-dependent enzyme [Bacteroidia bacterium]